MKKTSSLTILPHALAPKTLVLAGASLLTIVVILLFVECSIPSPAMWAGKAAGTASAVAHPASIPGGRYGHSDRQSATSEAYGKLPLSFEVNEGQLDSRAKFLARGEGYGLFLTSTGAVFALRKPGKQQLATSIANADAVRASSTESPAIVSMELSGGGRPSQITGLDELPGRANYFLSNDRRKWRRNIRSYAKVRYANVYPGVDVVYYGNQRELEYDFVIAPGADPGRIELAFEGASAVRVTESGDLVLSTGYGDLLQRKPVATNKWLVSAERSARVTRSKLTE